MSLPAVTSFPSLSSDPSPRLIGVVLPSGGARCWYQLGLLSVARERLGERARFAHFFGVSGGAMASVVFLAQRVEAMLEAVRTIARHRHARLDWRRLLHGRSPFPHGDLLADTLHRTLDGHLAGVLKMAAEGEVGLEIMAASLQAEQRYALRGAPVMLAHMLEVGPMRRMWIHPRVGRRMGFAPHWFRVDQSHRPEDLLEMLRATSCFPPLTPAIRRDGMSFFDGAFVTSLPDFEAAAKRACVDELWVVHTRRDQSQIFRDQSAIRHIKPSRRLRVGIWDMHNEVGILDAWDLGRRDGQRLADRFAAAHAISESRQ